MVVRYVTKNGGVMMGPPFTDEEKQDLYRRIAGGPWTVLRSAKAPRTADPGTAATSRQTAATSLSGEPALDKTRRERTGE